MRYNYNEFKKNTERGDETSPKIHSPQFLCTKSVHCVSIHKLCLKQSDCSIIELQYLNSAHEKLYLSGS